jgi:hypothetical protein
METFLQNVQIAWYMKNPKSMNTGAHCEVLNERSG